MLSLRAALLGSPGGGESNGGCWLRNYQSVGTAHGRDRWRGYRGTLRGLSPKLRCGRIGGRSDLRGGKVLSGSSTFALDNDL